MLAPQEKSNNLEMLVKLVNNSEISSIKQTIAQIMRILDDPRSSARDLKQIVILDPPLSAKLLRLANSAYYGYQRKIGEIQEAIVCVGFDAVKELTLRQKVCELFAQQEEGFGYSRAALWKHSVAVAHCSKLLCQARFPTGGDTAYVAGLLHDIGIIVMDQFMQYDFLIALRHAYEECNNLHHVEEDIIGFTHGEIGQAIARDWNFPDQLAVAIGHHHDPYRVEDEFTDVKVVLYLADQLIQERQIGFSDSPYRNRTLFQHCLMHLKIQEVTVQDIMRQVEAEVARMEQMGWY